MSYNLEQIRYGEGDYVNLIFNRSFKNYYDFISTNSQSFKEELANHIFKIELIKNDDIRDTEYIYYIIDNIDNQKIYSVYKFKGTNTDSGVEYLQADDNSLLNYKGLNLYISENAYIDTQVTGGSKKSSKLPKKEILGKLRCIYKVPGSRKEHIKYKGQLITVSDYKKLMKSMAKPKPKAKDKSKKK
jgi:hypothetical protein